ncbi:hypothetical protein [uncultured Oscillibacter sp.]|uniref:hypothetical protein n=1 Tax=uncultured Oscillibacter sp. TaxID=876091 RepID=UPI00260141F5|nr:hypothetical protein [uncultured Oscillibacter sp.]
MARYGSGPSKEDVERNTAGWDLVGFDSGKSYSGGSTSSGSSRGSSGSSAGSDNDGGGRNYYTDTAGWGGGSKSGPNMARDPSRAGQTIQQGMYQISYDDLGYAKSARKTSDSAGYVVDGVTYDGNNNVVPSGGRVSGGLPSYSDLVRIASSDAPTYGGSKWDDVLDKAVQELTRMNYTDWTQSDQYKALADRYGAQGRMNMQDVLGQISSRTGGLASSYAATAAQQQYNDYMSQLEEIARQMYAGERSDLISNAQLARQLGQDDYGKFQDRLAQWNADRSFDYQAGRDALSDQRYEQEYADSRSDYADSRADADRKEAQDRISAYLAAGGKASQLDAELIAGSGMSPEELTALESYYTTQAALEAQKTAKKSGGTSGGNLGRNQDYESLFAAAQESGYPKSFIANNYKKYGFSSSSGLYDEYGDWKAGRESGGGRTSLNWDQDEGVFTWNGRSYSSAERLLNEISQAGLTDNELTALKRKFKLFGFDLS